MSRPRYFEAYINGVSVAKESTQRKAWDAAWAIIREKYRDQWITIHLGPSGSEVRQ